MNSMIRARQRLAIPAAAALLLLPVAGHADDTPSNFSISGFASLIAGKTFGACVPSNGAKFSGACPTFVADYGYAGVYTPQISIAQESRVGVQMSEKINEQFSVTALVSSRPQAYETLNLDWAYVTWKPAPEWTVQAGRKRLPLFLSYDNMDVGYSLNMIRTNILVYGWTVTNYNGASVDYEFGVGDWSMRAEVYGGGESTKNNRFDALFYRNPQNVDWNGIVGGTLDFNHDWLSGRIGYMRSHFSQYDQILGQQPLLTGGYRADQNFLDIALNADFGNWIIKTELANSDQRYSGPLVTAWLGSVGYRLGRFTTTVEYGKYDEATPFDPSVYVPGHSRVYSIAERFDLRDNMDIKVQLDRNVSLTSPFAVDAISTALDIIF